MRYIALIYIALIFRYESLKLKISLLSYSCWNPHRKKKLDNFLQNYFVKSDWLFYWLFNI